METLQTSEMELFVRLAIIAKDFIIYIGATTFLENPGEQKNSALRENFLFARSFLEKNY